MSVRLAAMMLCIASAPALAGQPRVAIIIDDLGYQLETGRRAIELPGPVTFAVLPGTPRGADLAEWAHRRGKEVLLHLPLQANGADPDDEPIAIDLDMSRATLASAFDTALSSVPHVVGVNGHRGSLLTRHPGYLDLVQAFIREDPLADRRKEIVSAIEREGISLR